MTPEPSVLPPAGPAAPPRENGELVFAEPWESRAFGIAVALHEAGGIDFEHFRTRLIDEIRAWEGEHDPAAGGYRYYERWLRALERTVVAQRLVDESTLDEERRRLELEWAHDHD